VSADKDFCCPPARSLLSAYKEYPLSVVTEFTADFESLVAWLATRTDKTAITKLVRVTWRTVGRIIERVVADELGLSGILCKRRLDLGLALPALERKRHGRDPAGVVGRVVGWL
jgi:hypothetical protein